MTDYTLIPLETLALPPAVLNEHVLQQYLQEIKTAIDELNSKVEFVAASAAIVIPPSGG